MVERRCLCTQPCQLLTRTKATQYIDATGNPALYTRTYANLKIPGSGNGSQPYSLHRMPRNGNASHQKAIELYRLLSQRLISHISSTASMQSALSSCRALAPDHSLTTPQSHSTVMGLSTQVCLCFCPCFAVTRYATKPSLYDSELSE